MKLLILSVIITILSTLQAQAHRPYLIKDKTFKTSNGNIITERLFGDGIFTSDPVRYQIRNSKGALLATTLTAQHIASFCPSLKFCWAFPYASMTLLTYGLKFNHQNIDLNKNAPTIERKLTEKSEFQTYISNEEHTRFSSDLLAYPEFINDQDYGFEKNIFIALALSPAVILFDNFFLLAIIFFLTAIPIFIKVLFFKILKSKNKLINLLRGILGVSLVICTYVIIAIVFFIFSFTFMLPVFYMIFSMILGSLFATHLTKKA